MAENLDLDCRLYSKIRAIVGVLQVPLRPYDARNMAMNNGVYNFTRQ